jgi:hypothetical protein
MRCFLLTTVLPLYGPFKQFMIGWRKFPYKRIYVIFSAFSTHFLLPYFVKTPFTIQHDKPQAHFFTSLR